MSWGDLYRILHPRHYTCDGSAIQNFEESEFVRRMLGDEVAEHYAHFFKTEQRCFDQAVTDWERMRYFERI